MGIVARWLYSNSRPLSCASGIYLNVNPCFMCRNFGFVHRVAKSAFALPEPGWIVFPTSETTVMHVVGQLPSAVCPLSFPRNEVHIFIAVKIESRKIMCKRLPSRIVAIGKVIQRRRTPVKFIFLFERNHGITHEIENWFVAIIFGSGL